MVWDVLERANIAKGKQKGFGGDIKVCGKLGLHRPGGQKEWPEEPPARERVPGDGCAGLVLKNIKKGME